MIALGTITFCALLPRGVFTPLLPFILLVLCSSLTSAFKVQFPIASGSNMSVAYVVDIACLILRGPHATMVVGAASGWSQTTLNSKTPNPAYCTLFNMATLVITVQCAGQVYRLLGGTSHPQLGAEMVVPLGCMALTYFFVNTIPIAFAIAFTTQQSAWRIWKTDFASCAPTYLLGAIAADVIISVTESSGWLTILLMAAPLYLAYKMYRAGAESKAQLDAILEAAPDAIITMDSQLNILEFNPAAEQMFGYARIGILGRNVDLLLPPADRAQYVSALSQYLAHGTGPLSARQLELTALKADGTEFPVELTVASVGTDNRAVLTGFIGDITERRALEEQLRQSQKLQAIGQLAGGIAHDFNNILMSIMGAADLLLMQLRGDDAAREQVREIKQAVDRGAGLTRQLKGYSRIAKS